MTININEVAAKKMTPYMEHAEDFIVKGKEHTFFIFLIKNGIINEEELNDSKESLKEQFEGTIIDSNFDEDLYKELEYHGKQSLYHKIRDDFQTWEDGYTFVVPIPIADDLV